MTKISLLWMTAIASAAAHMMIETATAAAAADDQSSEKRRRTPRKFGRGLIRERAMRKGTYHRTLQMNSTTSTAATTSSFLENYLQANITADGLQEFFRTVDSAIESENVRGAAYAFRGPGMSAPVMKGFGLTESNDATAEPVDVDTAFMLASISKTYTGAAVAVLIDQGLISGLDEDICEVFGGETSTACRNPKYPDVPVTWRMLVTHRSSIQLDVPNIDGFTVGHYGPDGVNYYQDAVGNPTCPIDDTQQFFEDLFVQKETETTVGNLGGYSVNWFNLAKEEFGEGGVWHNSYGPGEKHEYSNIASAYIASLVERVSKKSYIDFCKEYVFDPVGMTNTAWFRRDLPEGTREAMPVYTTNTKGVFEDVGHYCFADYANGQLYSSIRDMTRYADVLLDYGVGTLWSETTAQNNVFGCQEKDASGTLLSDADCQNSLLWFYLSNELRDQDGPYSLIDHTNGIEHSGGEAGVATTMVVFPEADTYFIVITNTESADVGLIEEVVLQSGLELLGMPSGEGSSGAPDDDDYDDDGIDDDGVDDDDDDDGNGDDDDDDDDDGDVATEKTGGGEQRDRVLRGKVLDMINSQV